jgi:hypothetical protein
LPISLYAPLPLRIMDAPILFGAKAARLSTALPQRTQKIIAADVVIEFNIHASDVAMVYISPDPYGDAFKEQIDLCKFDILTHRMACLCFFEKHGRLLLAMMAPSTPGAYIPRWRTRLRSTWLIQIDDTPVNSIDDTNAMFEQLSTQRAPTCTLLFSHPEITPEISNKGLPIMSKSDFSQFTHNQLNNRINLMDNGLRVHRTTKYDRIDSGDILNCITQIMKLTRGKLLNGDNRTDWQLSKYLQLDQYDAQGMFGDRQ